MGGPKGPPILSIRYLKSTCAVRGRRLLQDLTDALLQLPNTQLLLGGKYQGWRAEGHPHRVGKLIGLQFSLGTRQLIGLGRHDGTGNLIMLQPVCHLNIALARLMTYIHKKEQMLQRL